jgi:hypothetical protein
MCQRVRLPRAGTGNDQQRPGVIGFGVDAVQYRFALRVVEFGERVGTAQRR